MRHGKGLRESVRSHAIVDVRLFLTFAVGVIAGSAPSSREVPQCFHFKREPQSPVRIKATVSEGLRNAVNTMITGGLCRVDFVAANTDAGRRSTGRRLRTKFKSARSATRGLGAGAKPEVGRDAALESKDEIRESLVGRTWCLVTAGMGGGTGTGAVPIVASIARNWGS